MENRTVLKGLVLTDEDFVICGNLEIQGNVLIKHANIIVGGSLEIKGDTSIEDGSIIVSEFLTFRNDIVNVSVKNGDIVAGYGIICKAASGESLRHSFINIIDGDIICVKGYLDAGNISSNGDIVVNGSSSVLDVTCKNYLISEENNSYSIIASEDIYIASDNYSLDLEARDIYLGGFSSNLNRSPIVASASLFVEGELIDCSSINVGQ